MLAFFRRILKNWVVAAVLALVALAIVVTGVGTPDGGGGLFGGHGLGGGAGAPIARMAGGTIGEDEVFRRAQLLFQDSRQQQPTMDVASFIAQGGLDAAVHGVVVSRATEAWSGKIGMHPSERQIDGEIAGIAAFQGPTGQFDRATFLSRLRQSHLTEAQLRQDVAGDIVRRQLLSPIAGGARASAAVVERFADTLLEKRSGTVQIIPAADLAAGPAPSDAEIKSYYTRNLPRYALPERRVLRYAMIGPDQVAAAAKPTDTEVAAYFHAHSADYAAREDRSFSRLVFPGEAAAKAFVAKVRGGTAFASAAQAAGFAPADIALGTQTRAALAGIATPQIAEAAFQLKQGAVTDPMKAPLGWFVVRADAVTQVAAKSLAQATPEITTLLAKQKGLTALGNLVNKLQGALDGGATFDELVKANGLTAAATPAVVATGQAPTDPAYRLPPDVQPLLKPAFEAEADDAPSLETMGKDKFALIKLGQVVPAAPRPLGEIHAAVAHDIVAERASTRARGIAEAVAGKVNGGMSLAAATAIAGTPLPGSQATAIRQYDFARFTQQHQPVPAALQALFRLKPGKARIVPAPNGLGWYVVRLDRVDPPAPAEAKQLAASSRNEFDQAVSSELAEEFSNAVVRAVNVVQDPAAIARLRTRLAGNPAGE